MTAACEVTDMFGTCGQPSAGRYQCGCIHEHIAEREACQHHVTLALSGKAICRTCLTLPGDESHACPVMIQPVGAGRVVAP